MSRLLHLGVSLQFLTQIIHIEATEIHNFFFFKKGKKQQSYLNNPVSKSVRFAEISMCCILNN